MKVAPHGPVHGVDVAALRVRPTCGALLAERVRRPAVEVLRRGVKVWEARHHLPPPVEEQLIGLETRGNLRRHDAVAVRFPIDRKFASAANHGFLARECSVGDWISLGAGILRGKNHGFRQIIHAGAEPHRNRRLQFQFARGLLSGCETS